MNESNLDPKIFIQYSQKWGKVVKFFYVYGEKTKAN